MIAHQTGLLTGDLQASRAVGRWKSGPVNPPPTPNATAHKHSKRKIRLQRSIIPMVMKTRSVRPGGSGNTEPIASLTGIRVLLLKSRRARLPTTDEAKYCPGKCGTTLQQTQQ